MLIRQAVAMLNTASKTVESLCLMMVQTDSTLLECPVVMAMNGVDATLSPQLMAEISNVTRFTHCKTLTVFASQTCERRSSRSWLGLSNVLLPMTLYAFMDKKQVQGKPYYIYMTTGKNKFLPIYYGRIKEYLFENIEAENMVPNTAPKSNPHQMIAELPVCVFCRDNVI